MGILKQAIGGQSVRTKVFDPSEGIGDISQIIGWRSVGGSGTYNFYKDHQYENGYSSISKLANGFAQIDQYTIDKNGKPVASNVLDRLYTPNTDMSHYDFREALAVTTLVHDKVRLRVHHRGTSSKFNADSILGFTFMEDYSETIVGGQRQYRMANGVQLTDEEVVTLKGVNPDKITEGFSPSRAARRWTRLDDYIADYQRGFFENGAVPAGQLIITARTKTEFNDIVDTLQARHKGAGKNNNVTYTHRPTDQEGKPMNAQIEWVPFSSTNKDMALKELFAQVNQKIDSVYGVPASIRGVNDQNTYASVRVDEVIFVKYALNPMALKIWSKFTHELNRITGSTGVAITYDLEIPKIADEEKVRAEAKEIDARTVSTLVEQGYTLQSAVDYIKTGMLESLILGKAPQKDEPEVLSAEEARGTPDQPIDIYSKAIKQVSVRDIPELYTGLEVDPTMVADASLRGCIMLKTERLDILKLVTDAESDLASDVAMDRSPVPGETSPHVTLLYGLLNNGNTWKDAVDSVLAGWKADSVTVDEVGFFTLEDSYAIVAHIKKTTELIDAHDRIGLLPNAETFSEYKPHMTLAYIKKDADLGKWIKALGGVYNGEQLTTAGIDYGDKPDTSKSIKKKDAIATTETELTEADKMAAESKLREIVRGQLNQQVNRAIESLGTELMAKAYGDPEPEQDDQFVNEAMAVILPILTVYGSIQTSRAIELLLGQGLSAQSVQRFFVTEPQRVSYRTYLNRIATYFNVQTGEKIRKIVDSGVASELTRNEIETNLRALVREEWRINRLANTEINRAGSRAAVMSMANVKNDTGYDVEKSMQHNGADSICEFCAARIGVWYPVDESMVKQGEIVTGVDGGQYVNNWEDNYGNDIHANGHCTPIFRVRRG
jgi:phage portal protein BeeE